MVCVQLTNHLTKSFFGLKEEEEEDFSYLKFDSKEIIETIHIDIDFLKRRTEKRNEH